jgi:hypothetical protein
MSTSVRHLHGSMFNVVMATSLLFAAIATAWGQGCVTARGAGMTSVHAAPGEGDAAVARGFQASVAYRYLNSDRHYVGSEEQKHRQQEGSEVINESHFMDVSLSYVFNERTSLTLTIPYAKHDRSSVVRDSNREILRRYHTQNAGLADLRLTSNTWLLDPKTHADGNILLGIGIDMPTADYEAEDDFDTYDATTRQIVKIRRPVDQSIQLGDGGWALLLDVFAYRRLAPKVSAYVNGFYSITPEETNGVPTYRGNPYEAEMGMNDSFMLRTGADFSVWPKHNVVLSLGARVEGVPVHELVGGDDGFRRTGYSVAIEPGLAATVGSYALSLYAPYSVYRNRTRSVADMRWTNSSGIYRHGDAAFADFLVMFNVAKAF